LSRPREPHFEKALFKATCRIIPRKSLDVMLPPESRCVVPLYKFRRQERLRMDKEDPYERILANEVTEHLNKAKMILILHRNAITGQEQQEAWRCFKRKGMDLLWEYEGSTVRMAINGTKYQNIEALYGPRVLNARTRLAVGPELALDVVFEIEKKLSPKFIVLAGIVEDWFMSRSQLERLAKYKDLTSARADLASSLNAAGAHLVQQLNQHQSLLVSYLDQHVQLLEEQKDINEPITTEATENPETDKPIENT